MAGVTETEGSLLAKIFMSKSSQIHTESDFKDVINQTNSLSHNLDVEKVTEFYLRNVNKSDSGAIQWAFNEFFGDISMTCPTYHFAKNYAKYSQNSNVFFYEITYQQYSNYFEKFGFKGVNHGADLPFVFGLPLISPQPTDTQTDIEFSKQVMKMWTNFAKYGYNI